MSKKTQKALKDARKLIFKDGWYQGLLKSDQTGAHCPIGAITEVVEGAVTYDYPPAKTSAKAVHALAEAIRYSDLSSAANYNLACILQERDQEAVICWNDGVAQTKDEVLAMFDKAIND